MEFLKYRHVVNLGDLISALPGMKQLYETTGKKAIIFQQLNRAGEYYEGASHPTKDEKGQMVCFNERMFEMIRPLLLAQEYIADFDVYKGGHIDYDLDVVRLKIYCGAPHYPLHKWTWMAYPEMITDLSKSWIKAPQVPIENLDDKIIVNFTSRYRNNNLNYFFLKEHEKDILFAGTRDEHDKFCRQWGLSIPYLEVNDFLELAGAIKGSRLFLGNQSFCWHLSQAMHTKRILELDLCFQNCTSFGANGYEAYHQPQMEYLVHKLYNS